MAVKFGSILELNNATKEATLNANNLRGTTIQIDSFNSASLATIGFGLTTAPGKRRLGTIVATTGSLNEPPRYYAYINSSSGDSNISGSEWTTLSNWSEIILSTNTGSFLVSSDIASFIDNSQTGSFITNSQTGSFVTNSQTGSFVVNSQTGSFVTNSQTGSFVVNSQTGSFVVNSQTGSFVVNSQTGSFVVNSQTGSFVINSQTGSFVTNSQTGSFVTNSQTGSFVTNSQTGSFVTNSQTGSFVTNSQTGSFAITSSDVTFNNITASGTISSSDHLFASLSYDSTPVGVGVVVYDTTNGQLYYTGSYGDPVVQFNTVSAVPNSNGASGIGNLVNATLQFSGSGGIIASQSVDGSTVEIGIDGSGIGGTDISGLNHQVVTMHGNDNPEGAVNLRFYTSSGDLNIGNSNIGLNLGSNPLLNASGSNRLNTGIGQHERSFFFNKTAERKPFARFSRLRNNFIVHPWSTHDSSTNAIDNLTAQDIYYPDNGARLQVFGRGAKIGHIQRNITTDKDRGRYNLHLAGAYPLTGHNGTLGPIPYHFIDFTVETDPATGNGSYVGSIEYHPSLANNNFVSYFGNFLPLSDKKLKTNIEDTKSGINDILKFKVKDFNWKASPTAPKTTGLIAQEVQEHFPTLVTQREDTLHLSITDVIPMLVKAVQDQQKEIEELKNIIKNKL